MTLALKNISHDYHRCPVLKNVDLNVPRRTLHCLIGPNGAGKSTLLRILSGILHPTSGSFELDGASLQRLPPYQFSRRGIRCSPQTSQLFRQLTAFENLLIGGQGLRRKVARDRAGEWLDKMSLTSLSHEPVHRLTHSQQRSLELGVAWMTRPDYLLLDEPTAGLSVEEIDFARQLILDLSRSTAIVIVEHNIAFVSSLSCNVFVLVAGELIASGPFHQIRNDDRVQQSYLSTTPCRS